MISRRQFLLGSSGVAISLPLAKFGSAFTNENMMNDRLVLLVSDDVLSREFADSFDKTFSNRQVLNEPIFLSMNDLLLNSMDISGAYIAGLMTWGDWELLDIFAPEKTMLVEKKHLPTQGTNRSHLTSDIQQHQAMLMGKSAADYFQHGRDTQDSHFICNSPYVSFLYSL